MIHFKQIIRFSFVSSWPKFGFLFSKSGNITLLFRRNVFIIIIICIHMFTSVCGGLDKCFETALCAVSAGSFSGKYNLSSAAAVVYLTELKEHKQCLSPWLNCKTNEQTNKQTKKTTWKEAWLTARKKRQYVPHKQQPEAPKAAVPRMATRGWLQEWVNFNRHTWWQDMGPLRLKNYA